MESKRINQPVSQKITFAAKMKTQPSEHQENFILESALAWSIKWVIYTDRVWLCEINFVILIVSSSSSFQLFLCFCNICLWIIKQTFLISSSLHLQPIRLSARLIHLSFVWDIKKSIYTQIPFWMETIEISWVEPLSMSNQRHVSSHWEL